MACKQVGSQGVMIVLIPSLRLGWVNRCGSKVR